MKTILAMYYVVRTNQAIHTYVMLVVAGAVTLDWRLLFLAKSTLPILWKTNGNHMDEICRHQRERCCGQAPRVTWELRVRSRGGKPCDLVKPAPFNGLCTGIYATEHPCCSPWGVDLLCGVCIVEYGFISWLLRLVKVVGESQCFWSDFLVKIFQSLFRKGDEIFSEILLYSFAKQ